jgi:acyl dehydratase
MGLSDGKFTEEGISELRSKIGTELALPLIFNDSATKARIRAFVDGIGDVNPLFRDENYAKNTRYGRIVAPPSWIYSVATGAAFTSLRGVHGFHSADDLEFYRPILVGDTLTPRAILRDVKEKVGKFAGRMIMEYHEKTYHNQRKELVAKGTALVIRTERSSAREKKKYSALTLPHPWTEEELKAIEDEALNEQIRGGNIRFWEDVEIHENLSPLVVGPLGLTDEIAFCMGVGGPLKAHGAMLRLYRKSPAWGFRDSETHALESIAAVHFNKNAAREAGLPYPYEVGVQRNCWFIQFLTDWMGDDGWLKRCYAEYRNFIYLSDAVWFRGEVTGKYIDNAGEHCVDIEATALNQRSQNTTVARATIILPSREAQTFPVAKRLSNIE